MGSELERRQLHQQQQPADPGKAAAYQAGAELARWMNGGGQVEQQPFSDPFFEQNTQRRVQRNVHTLHVISDKEYIVTDEVFYLEETSNTNSRGQR